MSSVTQPRRLLRAAASLGFFLSASLVAFAPTTSSPTHWYVVAPLDFYTNQLDADPWLRKIRKTILEDKQSLRVDLSHKTYSDLTKEQDNDPSMEIIQIRQKPADEPRKIRLVISIRWGSEAAVDITQPCGNPIATGCLENYWENIAHDVIQHDRQCHRGNTCSD